MPTEGTLHALISVISGERIAKELDERRSTIEYQFDEKIEISSGSVMAAILPDEYLKDKKFIKSINSSGIDVITYPTFPLNTDHYYYALYERCMNFYKGKGIFSA